MRLEDIKIDEDFKKRLRQQTPEEAESMRQSIDERGYLNPLIVWQGKGILIDGHHRYADWQRRMAEYNASLPKGLTSFAKTKPPMPPRPDFIQREFADREAVLLFIDELQAAKRNSTPEEMALIRGRYMLSLKKTMPERAAAEKTAETFSTSTRTARRDVEFAEAVAKLETAGIVDATNLPSRQQVHAAAEVVETDAAAAAVTLLERDAKDKRCKPRIDGAECLKPPAWERHLASLTKAIDALWKDSVDDDRKSVRLKLNELIKHVRSLDSAAA